MEDFEYIDQYLDGLLSAEEMAAVERRRATDADFAEEFAWQKALRETVSEQAQIDEMARSLMRRLKTEGHFDGPPIVPPQRSPFFRRGRFWWMLAVVVLGVCVWIGWQFGTQIVRHKPVPMTPAVAPPAPTAAQSERDAQTNPPQDPSNHSIGRDSAAARTQISSLHKARDMAQVCFEHITEKTNNTASAPTSIDTNQSPTVLGLLLDKLFSTSAPTSIDTSQSPTLAALQSGDTATAFQICRAAAHQNPDIRAFGALDTFARQQFEKGNFVAAYHFFETFARKEGNNLPSDERAQTLWRMFLCCAADWQRLNKEGRAVFPKIEIKNLPTNLRNEPMRLRRVLEQLGLW